MSTASSAKSTIPGRPNERLLSRIVEEGYGPGAWHGPNLKMAFAEVTDELAFWRPSPGRHSIAEIALHHAYCARSVRGQLSGAPSEPFVLEGDDWFELPGQTGLDWSTIQTLVDEEQRRLATLVADIGAGRVKSPLEDAATFGLVLGNVPRRLPCGPGTAHQTSSRWVNCDFGLRLDLSGTAIIACNIAIGWRWGHFSVELFLCYFEILGNYLLGADKVALPRCFGEERQGERSNGQNKARPSRRRMPFLHRQTHHQ